jgi:hypothetical protein
MLQKAGIPFFVNPYYLSLLHVRVPYFAIGADLAIRYYILYSQQLVDEFGKIEAWEKEDKVEHRVNPMRQGGFCLPIIISTGDIPMWPFLYLILPDGLVADSAPAASGCMISSAVTSISTSTSWSQNPPGAKSSKG